MGPLQGMRVIEIASIGPGPFCAMLLADLGADVLRIDRADSVVGADPDRPPLDPLLRGRRSVGVDLKHPDGPEVVLRLVEAADALIEGFRPGVAERLGIGPEACLARNPLLVYGRMTGWGQTGPLATTAGHDIDYIALAGVLGMIGRTGDRPVVPLNLVGDFGGGGMLLALGVTAGVLEARTSGQGQVVDAAMVDGAALLAAMFHGLAARGLWEGPAGTNLLDGGAPFYDVYETADGGFLAVGAIEPGFYAVLLEVLGLDPESLPGQYDRAGWPELRTRLAGVFRTKTRAEWEQRFAGTDACVAPVLSMAEASEHPHNVQRHTFIDVAGLVQPAPAPRYDRTNPDVPTPPVHPGQHTSTALSDWGFSAGEVDRLLAGGALA